MPYDFEKRLLASHELWCAKACARLKTQSELHATIYALRKNGKITDDAIDEIYDVIAANAEWEKAETAKAQAHYDEVHTHENS